MPALTADGATGAQVTSRLADTFAALMQAFLPGSECVSNVEGGMFHSSAQLADERCPPPRTRKDAAEVPDSTAGQMLLPQLPITVVLPPICPTPLQAADAEIAHPVTSAPSLGIDAAQQDATTTNDSSATQLPLETDTAERRSESAPSLEALTGTGPLPANIVHGDVVTRLTQQSQARSANATSFPAISQLPHPARTQAGIAADVGSSANSQTTHTSRSQFLETTSREGPATMTASGAPALTSREAIIRGDGHEVVGVVDAATPVVPADGNSVQSVSVDSIVQAGYTSHGAPAIALDMQTSSGDTLSDSQDDAEGSTFAERKGSQGTIRTSTSLVEGDTHFGMGGWIVSTPHSSSPVTQGPATKTAPLGSSSMTNMSLDRIASESSARRLTNALRSDMSFGVQTDAFGKVNIQAALHGDQLASQISLEHGQLHASMLAVHLPNLELRLGEKYNVDATVTVRDGSTNTSTNQQSPSQQNSRQNTPGLPVKKANSIADTAGSISILLPEQRHSQQRLTPATGRLDLVI